ncbi:MAG TPA: tripartite tricarboxylate transporter substrate binding protein [Usitatibacter sp.]|nr:tripartite tricarboxylate transporter substrate binding protein [Usitatibacter sp.]
MQHERRRFLGAMGATLAGAALPALAQEGWPGKPIRIIVPFTAGSATDILARTYGDRLTAAFGQPAVIENHPGAGGTIGAALTAKAPPDGTTLVVVSTGHVVNDVLYDNIPYDTVDDFAGVALLGNLPSVLIVPPSLGVKTVKDLVALVKERKNDINYCTAGIGSASHINMQKFLTAAGIDGVHVPLKGTPDMLTQIMSGRIEMSWAPLISSIGPIKDGKVQALAVSTKERSAVLPDVPTIAEAGYPAAEFNFWVAMLAPAKTPKEIVRRINAEILKANGEAEVKKRMANLGAEPMPMTSDQLDAFLRDEHDVLGKIMRSAKKS